MCDAVYLEAALVGLLAVGTVLRVFVGKSPNADLIVSLLADEHPLLKERDEPVVEAGSGQLLASV